MSNTAPPEWWKDEGVKKPGPSRIRVTLNRVLTAAEHEHLVQVFALVVENVGDKVRIAPDDRIYAESTTANSRSLYATIATTVERAFVNVFPVAVRTFRELVVVKKLDFAGVQPTVTFSNSAQGGSYFMDKDKVLTPRTPGVVELREDQRSSIMGSIQHLIERYRA